MPPFGSTNARKRPGAQGHHRRLQNGPQRAIPPPPRVAATSPSAAERTVRPSAAALPLVRADGPLGAGLADEQPHRVLRACAVEERLALAHDALARRDRDALPRDTHVPASASETARRQIAPTPRPMARGAQSLPARMVRKNGTGG